MSKIRIYTLDKGSKFTGKVSSIEDDYIICKDKEGNEVKIPSNKVIRTSVEILSKPDAIIEISVSPTGAVSIYELDSWDDVEK